MGAVTGRAAQRQRQIEEIKRISRELIAGHGVSGLSLRQVSREMGMVSSSLYRYFATRDDLLTALIFDGYNELGVAVERAERRVARGDIRGRWRAAASAVRSWSKRHPHDYALLYGTPVPGYAAPTITIGAATRVPMVLARILDDDRRNHPRRRPLQGDDHHDFLEIANLQPTMPHVESSAYLRALMAWMEIFGFVSFELFGHLEGSAKNVDVMFDRVVDELADFLELSSAP